MIVLESTEKDLKQARINFPKRKEVEKPNQHDAAKSLNLKPNDKKLLKENQRTHSQQSPVKKNQEVRKIPYPPRKIQHFQEKTPSPQKKHGQKQTFPFDDDPQILDAENSTEWRDSEQDEGCHFLKILMCIYMF